MDRHERLSAMLELLGRRGRVEIEDLAAGLTVSAATIRRDLDHLAEQQLLTRTRGGAVVNNVSYELPLRYKSGRRAPEKSKIAQCAAALVAQGDVIGLNGGTTTTEVARALATRGDLARTSDGRTLTVVTNALNIANELAVRQNIKLVVTGGVARPQSFELTGPLATRVLGDIGLDILFLGVDAFDPDSGAYAHHEGEASINALMVQRASKVVVVADSSKLGRHAFTRICPLSGINALVTDSGAPADVIAAFQSAGVAVHQV
ncbi:DeoR/GlpR family DNA-binding transcription regulator [Actinokineospora xionganensis]|uniref:DeoR/GlpR transcriptional regulator n=1 Tax=Actinokineospora xionganensis TaxID=2684470 RepID=A0ABR7LE58_9PSEU|nr:DeoR/GlpR family DNA-binding transcription regulator [Actinokineospora xionganensis]MBC6450694.1 DeoR/GlpR transcriptional regulator [Actinokineospora xionganensis]